MRLAQRGDEWLDVTCSSTWPAIAGPKRRRWGGRAAGAGCPAAGLLHQHLAEPLQVLDHALGGDAGHDVVGVVDALAP